MWIEDFTTPGNRTNPFQAAHYGLKSGWAAPVRVGNRLIAVLEFYSLQSHQEDRECIATVETISAPLGQMLARSREEERVEELHHTQQILLDTIEDGICAVGESGAVTLLNPAAAKLLRGDTQNLVGKTLHELLHGNIQAGGTCDENCLLLGALRQRKATSGSITIFRHDRSSFPAEFSLTPILDNGHFSGSVLSFRDITQRYALDRMKDEFVSTVSHELRTPLTSIRGALGLLSSGILGQLNDKAANLLRIALSNSDRLVRLINDILDLERIQSGREPLAFRPVALNEIVQQAIDGMHPVADAAGIQLIQDATAVQLNADPDRLLQIITNLLSNAIKFSPAGATVAITLRAGSSGVILSVIDQGRGIPADKLDTIFDRFQQVDASDSRQKGGSGLGLAICRTIVEQHGGKIWAERNAVRGSTFRVLLPFQPLIELSSMETPLVSSDQGLILIADSNDVTRATIANQLRRHGYSVLETASIQQTIDALWLDKGTQIPAKIEAILVDTSLDSLNGWEILPLLRKHPAAGTIPIVLLSVDHKDPSQPLPAGADGWIPKPAQDQALLYELARVLSAPGEKARILVVEDDLDLARVIGAVFSRDGIEVKLVHSRQDALDACLSFKPQLIVLDLSLPDGDGFNVVDWLRQNDSLAHLPLVVYSAREIPPSERSLLQLGPTQFLTKARVQPQQLESLVLTMLRRSRQKKESEMVDSYAQQAISNDPSSSRYASERQ
uniref:histidine kinase n=1 Tax=mine drainage metagenome TaxID=410659 RepID=E6PZM4_9ZZZZ